MNYTFGDIVIVEGNPIGVVVKCWGTITPENKIHYEVYVRSFNGIKEYTEDQMRRYMVRHKELSEDEMYYQNKIDNRGGGEDSNMFKIEQEVMSYLRRNGIEWKQPLYTQTT